MAAEQLNLKALQRSVAQAGHTWLAREAMFSDAEFQNRLGVLQEPSPTEATAVAWTRTAINAISPQLRQDLTHLIDRQQIDPARWLVPARWDWRDQSIIGDVRDQGQCGSCVSFAVTGLVGAMGTKEHGTPNLHLSEAELHFDSSHGANCGGWWPDQALQVVKDKGVVLDSAFDYSTAFDTPPQWDGSLWKAHARDVGDRTYVTWKIGSYAAISDHDGLPILKTYLRTTGPLVAAFDVYTDFNYYGGGVYKHTSGAYRGGHAVLVVGYDDGDQSWIVRNSWGTGFGGAAHPDGSGGGYFKIGYGECKFDTNPMYGATGTLPPPNLWWQHLIGQLKYTQRLQPIGPIFSRVVNLTEPATITH
ncbi:MAG: C1 family peptidase [Mycobacteriales bacterium]